LANTQANTTTQCQIGLQLLASAYTFGIWHYPIACAEDGVWLKHVHGSARETINHSNDLRLYGDFDGSSAWELINLLDESEKKATVAIDTNGLKTIDAFGLAVFLPQMSKLNNTQADIQITGRFRSLFREA
jgi:stage II sporulation protein AA (anti-sigma F factor antagonist)